MADYLACGNIMLDVVENRDGSLSRPNPGGPAFFALEGMRILTKSCKLVCNAGVDFKDTYSPWMALNGVSEESVSIAADRCTQHVLKYDEDGSGRFSYHSRYGDQLLGFLKTKPEQIEAAAETAKGMYLAQNTDRVFWEKLSRIKEKTGLKIMWETEALNPTPDFLQRVREVISIADMFSINLNEASEILGIPPEQEADIINELMKLPVAQIFFRVGKRGAYLIGGNTAVFAPSVDIGSSVDPTGCGNCSTGAALVAQLEGFAPAMVVALANVAAGYNAAQYGVYPHVTDAVMQDALALARRIAAQEIVR